jgi:glyoxylase-like metal-dependent hydrolase (beta-lactamase superfamily II)
MCIYYWLSRLSGILLATAVLHAAAADPSRIAPREVAPGIYAVIGDLGPQTATNEGLNANLGFVVGNESVLVINTGPSESAGQALLAAVRSVTSKPVRWAVNLNHQSHYWWGNAAFANVGATLLAHPEAIRLMQDQGGMQRETLTRLLGTRFEGSTPALPRESVADTRELDLGGRRVRILYAGPAHTPGDLMVWVPDAKLLFAGDVVFTQRLLAVLPLSNTRSWLQAFERAHALGAERLVPGHGAPTDWRRGGEETLAYLEYMRREVKRLLDAGTDPDKVASKVDQSRWSMLVNFDALMRRNAYQMALEIERE